MSYVLPPRRVIQAMAGPAFVPETEEERQILEAREDRERKRIQEKRDQLARHLAEHEARRVTANAESAAARARPTQILARQIADAHEHYVLHRLIQDLAKTNREQLVAELLQAWQVDEDKRQAGKLTKPLNAVRRAELDQGAL